MARAGGVCVAAALWPVRDAAAAKLGEGRRRDMYQPYALRSVGLYPNWHPLRRRGRHFPRVRARGRLSSNQAMYCLPPRWAHYTESLGDSVSIAVTQRFTRPRDDRRLDTVAAKFRHWMEKSDRPNALARLVSSGLVDGSSVPFCLGDAALGEVERVDQSGWMSTENDEWRHAAIDAASIAREHIVEDDLIGIYCSGWWRSRR